MVIRTMIFALLLLLLSGYLFFVIVKKDPSGSKFILLGLAFIGAGGIIAVDGDSSLAGIEYFFVLVGLIFSVVGFGKND